MTRNEHIWIAETLIFLNNLQQKKGVHESNFVTHYGFTLLHVNTESVSSFRSIPNVHNCICMLVGGRKTNNLKISIGISHNHTDNNLHFMQ
jgi:hypothetical protein